ncbi:hypothetical protein GCM10010384_22380 [Streptomyces djakartensis]|uniref:Uncharacterized protein n=1 Tax=Streptomyces djakartensis TaxID=68193 RepID=A0ABQ2ZKB8_9ACTN|nr:hypothetical protein GCM10010384_22380 [Streptomyces djakartensis]
MKHTRVLVVGAGLIGTDVARALSADHEVILHGRRRASVEQAAQEVGVPPDRAWYGDLVAMDGGLTNLDGKCVQDDAEAQGAWALGALVRSIGPTVVVDATNIATSSADHLIFGPAAGQSAVDGDLGLENAAKAVRGRAMELHRLLRSGSLIRYLRISTTGLGARGLEVPFTHGDAGSWMSPALWHKVLFAGMEHQVLWALARSYPGRVNLVIPAAFVGFEQMAPLVEGITAGESAEVDLLAAGEDRSYTAEELAVLSSPFQMGAVTREDVTEAVLAVLTGSDTSRDVTRAMTEAALGPTVEGYVARNHIIRWLRSPRDGRAPLLTSGALGRRVSRGLILLAALKASWEGPLWGHLMAPSETNVAAQAVLPKDLLATAEQQGLSVGTTHEQPASGDICLCPTCFESLGSAVLSRLREWYDHASAADRLQFRELAGTADWPEGDVLAILWQGAGSEAMPF